MSKQKEDSKLTNEERIMTIAGLLHELREGGFVVGIRSVPRKEERPSGVMIFLSGVDYSPDDGFAVLPQNVPQEV